MTWLPKVGIGLFRSWVASGTPRPCQQPSLASVCAVLWPLLRGRLDSRTLLVSHKR